MNVGTSAHHYSLILRTSVSILVELKERNIMRKKKAAMGREKSTVNDKQGDDSVSKQSMN